MIENRPGGGTNIANEMVLRSEPDGHAVLMGGSSQATTRGLYHSLSYDPIGDFAPVALICSYSFFMFVPNSLPVKSPLASSSPTDFTGGNSGTNMKNE